MHSSDAHLGFGADRDVRRVVDPPRARTMKGRRQVVETGSRRVTNAELTRAPFPFSSASGAEAITRSSTILGQVAYDTPHATTADSRRSTGRDGKVSRLTARTIPARPHRGSGETAWVYSLDTPPRPASSSATVTFGASHRTLSPWRTVAGTLVLTPRADLNPVRDASDFVLEDASTRPTFVSLEGSLRNPNVDIDARRVRIFVSFAGAQSRGPRTDIGAFTSLGRALSTDSRSVRDQGPLNTRRRCPNGLYAVSADLSERQ